MAAQALQLENLQGGIVDAVEGGEERVMERVNAVYELLKKVAPAMGSGGGGGGGAKTKAIVSLDVDKISLVKGKKGKLGRGSQGKVQLAHLELQDETTVPIAVSSINQHPIKTSFAAIPIPY